jgi:hypothetical protein
MAKDSGEGIYHATIEDEFKSEFAVALREGRDIQFLMEHVRRHRRQGMSIDAVYAALQDIWSEYGFDRQEAEEGSLQDRLETVMEKIWYGTPV